MTTLHETLATMSSCMSVASIKRKAYWCCEFPYATKKTRIVYDKIAKDLTMNASEIKKIRPKHVDVGYQKLYTDLKFYKRTLQFQASLVCDSAQGRCGFMRRHPTEAADSAYNSASAGSRNSADVYPNARDVITKTNGERAFFKFSVKADTHTLGFYEWLVAKSMMLRCSYIPNFMRPYTYTKNTLVINHFVDSDDDPNDDSSTEDNGDGGYVDSISCPIRKKRIRRRRIEVRRDDNDYLLTDVNPFEVDTDTSKAVDKDVTVTDVGVFEVVEGVSLRSSKLSTHQLSSVTYQLCMALLMAQAANGFVHNDLHWKNVILTECDPRLHLTYIYRCTGNGRRIIKRTIPTHGYIPVIIDFGFAFCNELAHESHNPEVLYADHIGYVTYETDNVVDIMRTLLEYSSVCRLPDELMCRMKYCVKHNGRIKVGENSGWYNFETKVTRLLQEAGYVNHRRRGYLMGAIKRCIRLPLNSSNVQLVTDSMEQEFGLKRYDLKSCVLQLVHALRHVNCTTIGDFVCFIRDCSDAVRVKDPLTAAFAVKQRHGHLVVGDGEHFVDYNGLVTMIDPISNVCIAMNNINYYSTRELEANAKIMRNRRKELWKRTGTGEDLFMSIEEILRKSSSASSTYTARAKDPVLIIDSVRRQNRYAVLGDVLKL